MFLVSAEAALEPDAPAPACAPAGFFSFSSGFATVVSWEAEADAPALAPAPFLSAETDALPDADVLVWDPAVVCAVKVPARATTRAITKIRLLISFLHDLGYASVEEAAT
jgi:hypothetical protein